MLPNIDTEHSKCGVARVFAAKSMQKMVWTAILNDKSRNSVILNLTWQTRKWITKPMNRVKIEKWSGRSPIAWLLFCACLSLTIPGHSAQDGNVGIESSGSIAISLKIAQGVQITDLEDWDLTVSRDNAGSDYQFVKDFCVRGTIGSRISVSAWTNNVVGNKFSLTSAENEPMPFQLEFNPEISTGQYEEISPVDSSSVYTISSHNNCNAGNNSEIRIVFDEEDIMAATSLEFSGDLFITVELL